MAAKHLQLTDELQEKATLFAAGALPESERTEYARHLQEDDCAICRNEALESQAAVNLLVFSTPLQSPSPRVRDRLLTQARAAAPAVQLRPAVRRRWFEWAAGVVAVAASVALVVVLNDNVQLRRLADSLSGRVAQLESQITEQRVRLASLASPQVRVVNLAGQGATSNASGRIFWDQARRRWYFFAQNLPQTPNDKTYQLWFVPNTGNPVSAGVFNTATNGTAQIEIPVPDAINNLKAAAVTTEPAGGLPQPSGAFALLGSVE